MIFNGTILITDPCYFVIKKDWCSPGGFDSFDKIIHPSLGFSDYIWISTGFGDTTGIVLGKDQEKIGSFCVDSGTYGVFYLSEIESYNPGMDYHFRIYRPDLGTIIENYSGDIQVIKKSTSSCNINCLSGFNLFAEP